MAQVPNNFQVGADPSVASFDYLDAITGQGYRKLYALGTDNNGSAKYVLSPVAVDGDITYNATTGAADVDFDLLFNNPAIIQGEAYISYVTTTAGGSNISIVWNLYLVRNGVETLIATKTSGQPTASLTVRRTTTLTIPRTKIAPDDTLRLNAVVTGTSTFSLKFDPAGRQTVTESGSGASLTYSLYAFMPFVLDL